MARPTPTILGRSHDNPYSAGRFSLPWAVVNLASCGSEAHVAVAGQHHPHARRWTIHRGDHGRRQCEVVGEVRLEAFIGAGARHGNLAREPGVVTAGLGVLLQCRGVRAGTEATTLSGHHHHPHAGIDIGLLEAPAVLMVHPAGPGIHALGTVEGDGGHAFGHLVAHRLEFHPGPLFRGRH